jgi:hypothetical protein
MSKKSKEKAIELLLNEIIEASLGWPASDPDHSQCVAAGNAFMVLEVLNLTISNKDDVVRSLTGYGKEYNFDYIH